jgi:hypothetical protein
VELLVLLGVGIALIAVYRAVAALTTWWVGFRNRHKALLRAVPFMVVAIAFIVVGDPRLSTVGRVVDVAIGALVALVLLGVVGLAVVGWRRPGRRHAVAPPAVPQLRPLVERSRPGRNLEYDAPQSRRPPIQRGGSRWRSVYNAAGREVFVYAFGAFDNRSGECRKIKIGYSAGREGIREAQVEEQQVGKTETVRSLGRGPGGEPREKAMHRRLDEWRYPRSEWFEPSPEVLAEVATLERMTDDGRRLTEGRKRSA